MLDTLTGNNAADFKARYQGTFCWFMHDGQRLLVRIDTVQGNKVIFTDFFDRKLEVYVDSNLFFEFLPLSRRWNVTQDGTLFYTARVPARQWKRGICDENTQLCGFDPASRVLLTLPMRNLFQYLHNIDQFPKNNLNTYLKDPSKGAYLSRHFVISPTGKFYFLLQEAGTFTRTNKLELYDDVIAQEVSDLITRENLPIQL